MLQRPGEYTNLNDNQIAKLIEHFLDKLIEQMKNDGKISAADAAHLMEPDVKNRLITEIHHALKRDDGSLKMSDLHDPEFTEKFLMVCTTALLLEKNFKNENTLGLDRLKELVDKLKKV